MTFEEIKLYVFSLFTLTMSYSNLDKFLKLLLLVITIGYAIDKWVNHRKNNFKDK